MAIAEARSRYVLDDSASPTMRGIRREAGRTTVALKETGSALDNIGTPAQHKRLDRLEAKFRKVGTGAETMQGRVDSAGRHMEGSIRTSTLRAEGRLEGFDRRLRETGRIRASPTVELDGVVAARLELAYLTRELNQFGRKSEVARVMVASSGGGSAGGGGGGGGAIGGGGRRGGLWGAITRPVSIPFAGAVPAGLLAAALPVTQGLVGGAGALVGSAGAGALGGGAIGAAGVGASVAGVGLLASVMVPAIKGLKEAKKAQDAYNKSVEQYGRHSTQATTAKKKLDIALEHTPRGGARLLREKSGLSRDWQAATRPAQGQLTTLGGNLLSDVRSVVPQLSGDANVVAGAANQQGSAFGNYLTGQRNMIVIRELSGAFADNMDEAEHVAEHLIGTFGNVARASIPFFHEGMVFLDHWTGGWETGTHDIDRTRDKIGGFVDDLRTWGRLAGATGRLMRDLLGPSREPGSSMVQDLTATLDRWDTWAQANPDRIRSFFRDAVSSTEDLAGFLATIVKDLNTMATLLQPILSRFSQLAQLGSGAGLLLPTALRYALFRRGAGKGGGGVGELGGGVAGRAAQAEVAGGAAPMGIFGRARAAATGPIGKQGFTLSDRVDRFRWSRQLAAERSLWGGAGATGTLGAVRDASVGLGGAAAGKVAAGARAVAPIVIISGALGAATTPGNVLERVQGAASAATLGAVPAPVTAAQARDESGKLVEKHLANFTQPTDPRSTRQRIGAIRRAISFQQGVAGDEGSGLNQAISSVTKPLGAGGYNEDARKIARGEVKGFTKELGASQRLLREQLDQQSVKTARSWSESLGGAFDHYSKRGGPVKAMEKTTAAMQSQLKQLRPAGKRELAQNSLAWARQMLDDNPKLKAPYHDLKKSIIADYKAMGENIRIVNGTILTGTVSQWKQISAGITGPLQTAAAKANGTFGEIQRMAIGSLQTMGFSHSDATQLVHQLESGKWKGDMKSAVQPGGPTGTRGRGATTGRSRATARAQRARGGIIPGHGLADTVPVGDRHVAAPGEGWVANRHTMRRLDRMLGAFGTDFRREVQDEKAPHGAPLRDDQGIMPDASALRARGGRVVMLKRGGRKRGSLAGLTTGLGNIASAGGVAANVSQGGRPVGNLDAMIAAANAIDRHHYPYRWGGGHDPNFTAPYDCSGAVSAVLHAGGALGSPMVSGAMTTLGSAGPGDVTLYANAGHVYMSMLGRFFGTSTANPGGGAGWFAGGARPGFTVRHVTAAGGARGAIDPAALGGAPGQVSLKAPRSGMAGVPGALADRTGQIYAAGLQAKLNDALGTMTGAGGGGALGGFTGGGSARANQALGRRMMLAYGFGPEQWPPLRSLWQRESGWNQNARNPSSGAAGIPQALGHGDIGSDPAGQIAWGLRYIGGRYGNPAGAWAHSQATGWYGLRGGHPGGADIQARRPTIIGVGDHPRGEDVTVRPRPLGPGSHPSGGRARGGRGRVAGLSVTIQRMEINYRGKGDIKRVVRDEIGDAIAELADELENGVATDEEAVLA